jgi:hemoglobin
MSAPAVTATLYERLGGVYSIATVVDDFIDRIMVDPRLNANPAVDDAHHKVPLAGFKEWEAFADDFQQTLDKFQVPAPEQAELRAIVASTYADIVVGKA